MATNSPETHTHIDPVFKQILEDNMKMKRRDGKMTYEESLQFLVKDFGDDIIKILPIEKRLEGLDPTQRLEGLTSEQILTALAQK